MKVRRVVTGHDSSGKAMVVLDEEVEPITLALSARSRVPSAVGGQRSPALPGRRRSAA